jgi:hypothetical protein
VVEEDDQDGDTAYAIEHGFPLRIRVRRRRLEM